MAGKVQRWTDLIAALLQHHYPVRLDQLAQLVPGYSSAPNLNALRRTFERDKDELRTFGVPIETVRDEAGETIGYRLKAREFYLPYLSGADLPEPAPVRRPGFANLPRISFGPAELAALAGAAKRVESAGVDSLTELARSACRKLAVDLPIDAVAQQDPTELVPARAEIAPGVFDALDDALARRKRVEFDYYSIGADATSRRTVEPFGLFFLGQHWYLAAREPGGDPVKNYRLSRITNVKVNPARPATPDYAVPEDFRLREHARSRQAWELGDGDELAVEIAFPEASGAAVSAARLGEPVEGHPSHRRFRVRRLDAFVRWLLSLGGAARPVGPDALLTAWRDQVNATAAVYGGR